MVGSGESQVVRKHSGQDWEGSTKAMKNRRGVGRAKY